MSIILSPSSSLQFRFLRRWASSITTQRHGTLRSSGQSVRIISKVVMTAWNRYAPFIILPWRDEERQRKRKRMKVNKNNLKCLCHNSYLILPCGSGRETALTFRPKVKTHCLCATAAPYICEDKTREALKLRLKIKLDLWQSCHL